LNESPDLLQQVNDLGSTCWSGKTFRHTAPGRDGLSGVGALLFGGRWNPPDLVSTIYVASPVETCIAEFERTAKGQARGVASFLQREVHEIDIIDLEVVDLRTDGALSAVGLTTADLDASDWSPCQRIGELAHYLGLQGIVAPSATGSGIVIAIFEPRIRPGQLIVATSRPIFAYA
jgi:RES domain-containing protein